MKRRKIQEQLSSLALPVVVFLVIYLLYKDFPDLIGAVDYVAEKVSTL